MWRRGSVELPSQSTSCNPTERPGRMRAATAAEFDPVADTLRLALVTTPLS